MALGVFLGDHQDIGKGCLHNGADQRVGGFVGLGHRAGICFLAGFQLGAAIDLHDLFTGLQRRAAKDGFDELMKSIRHDDPR